MKTNWKMLHLNIVSSSTRTIHSTSVELFISLATYLRISKVFLQCPYSVFGTPRNMVGMVSTSLSLKYFTWTACFAQLCFKTFNLSLWNLWQVFTAKYKVFLGTISPCTRDFSLHVIKLQFSLRKAGTLKDTKSSFVLFLRKMQGRGLTLAPILHSTQIKPTRERYQCWNPF